MKTINRLQWPWILWIGISLGILSVVSPSLALVVALFVSFWVAMRVWYAQGATSMENTGLLIFYILGIAILATLTLMSICNGGLPIFDTFQSCKSYSPRRIFGINLFGMGILPLLVFLFAWAMRIIPFHGPE